AAMRGGSRRENRAGGSVERAWRARRHLRMLSLMASVRRGTSSPLGATLVDGGVNFSIYSKHSTRLELLLFDDAEHERPSRIIHLGAGDHRSYHYWHIFVPDIRPGQVYAYRAEGPNLPDMGLRYDPEKVLLDPYAKLVAIPSAYDRRAAIR